MNRQTMKVHWRWLAGSEANKRYLNATLKLKACFLFFCITVFVTNISGQANFTKGVNLSEWFQTDNVRDIYFKKYTKEDFRNIADLGCDVIRLPVFLSNMTSGAPDYTFDPLFYELFDQVVGWSNELGMNLVISNHLKNLNEYSGTELSNILSKLWLQISEHYKDNPENILYEIMNEPYGMPNDTWYTIQQSVIKKIREVDTIHTIIAGASEWNHPVPLSTMPAYAEDNLIYTFHLYTPYIFTHQGSVKSLLEDFWGIPFPYDSVRMPVCPDNLAETWVYDAVKNYPVDGTTSRIKSLIDTAVTFMESNHVNLFCGEMGVLREKTNRIDRLVWYQTATGYLTEKEIPWTIWDYKGNFGLFYTNTNELFENDLDTSLLSVLGFSIPAQVSYEKLPVTKSIRIFDDYIEKNILKSNELKGGLTNYYSDQKPAKGKHSIYWEGSDRYANLGFNFEPDCDFTYLKNHNYSLKLYVRGDNPSLKLQIRFVDTKKNKEDHPWRISFEINNDLLFWNNEWQLVEIPLTDFIETGAWDSLWYNPQGDFDWSDVDRFEIAAEYSSLQDTHIGIDEISISESDTKTSGYKQLSSPRILLFPNPAANSVTIQFGGYTGELNLSILNARGKTVRILPVNPGSTSQTIYWDAKNDLGKPLAPGLYICRLKTAYGMISEKFIVR